MSFKDSLALTLGFEGGFANDPDDPGGATNKGITQATYNTYRQQIRLPPKDVRDITQDEVESIYSRYWTGVYGDKIDSINPRLAQGVFDFGVNAGEVTAVKALQRMLGCDPDGIYGPMTEAALKNDCMSIGMLGVVRLYAYERIKYYTSLAIRKPVMKKFLTSWLSRTIVSAGEKL